MQAHLATSGPPSLPPLPLTVSDLPSASALPTSYDLSALLDPQQMQSSWSVQQHLIGRHRSSPPFNKWFHGILHCQKMVGGLFVSPIWLILCTKNRLMARVFAELLMLLKEIELLISLNFKWTMHNGISIIQTVCDNPAVTRETDGVSDAWNASVEASSGPLSAIERTIWKWTWWSQLIQWANVSGGRELSTVKVGHQWLPFRWFPLHLIAISSAQNRA